MDIAIFGDRSTSMKRRQRNRLIDLVKSLVDDLGVSTFGNHFAIGTFASKASINNDFKDPDYHNAKNLKAVVRQKFHNSVRGTRPDTALKKAVTKLFVPWAGDRPNAENVLLVFTDGKWRKKAVYSSLESMKALEVLEF